MIDGLIVTGNKKIFEELSQNFSSEQIHFEYAGTMSALKEAVIMEQPDFIIIAEEKIEEMQPQIEFLKSDNKLNHIPVICMTAGGDWLEREVLWQSGVKDVIQLPVLKNELKIRLNRFVGRISSGIDADRSSGMQGRLEDFNLIDLIQTLDQNLKTGILTLKRNGSSGKIWVYQGKVYNCEYKKFESMAAILNMATWIEGEFNINFVDEEYEQKIQLDTDQILLESIQRIDEKNRWLQKLPPVDERLLISPFIEMEKIDTDLLKYLKFFQGGKTIRQFLLTFDEDEIFLLEIVAGFAEKKHIMIRAVFDQQKLESEEEISAQGLSGVFKNIFSRKAKKPVKSPKKITIAQTETKEEKPANESDDIFFESIFIRDDNEIQRFKQHISEL